ncbi:MAG: accessory factor UbiK family protein [Rickettsiales bacterium]|nr:accessory factor UbiK family protein [Rickettsiales bacterium]
MQKNNQFFDDIAKMATGAASSMLEMRHEVERMVQQQFEKLSTKMNFVTREEFEIVRKMAQKAREENEALRKELSTLKPKKTAAKKPTTAKKAAPKKKS